MTLSRFQRKTWDLKRKSGFCNTYRFQNYHQLFPPERKRYQTFSLSEWWCSSDSLLPMLWQSKQKTGHPRTPGKQERAHVVWLAWHSSEVTKETKFRGRAMLNSKCYHWQFDSSTVAALISLKIMQHSSPPPKTTPLNYLAVEIHADFHVNCMQDSISPVPLQ